VAAYELTSAVDADLQAIADYTVATWGLEQAQHYAALLEKHFRALNTRRVRTRVFLRQRPEILVSRCEHHYVFHLVRPGQCPLILAVLHENMDLVSRLKDRLDARSTS
jgi:plasmid stabilization system protein ParE